MLRFAQDDPNPECPSPGLTAAMDQSDGVARAGLLFDREAVVLDHRVGE